MKLSRASRHTKVAGESFFFATRRLFCSGKFRVMTVLIGLLLLAVPGQGRGSCVWEGGDWGGLDFAPGDGDILSGSFTDIGRFVIGAGDTVLAGSSSVVFAARDIMIDGVFRGGSEPASTLDLRSETGIVLHGALDRWSSLTLTGGNIVFTGSISLVDRQGGTTVLTPVSASGTITVAGPGGSSFAGSKGTGDFVSVPEVPLTVQGGTITVNVVPLPSALLFLAPGLAGVLLIKRSPRVCRALSRHNHLVGSAFTA